MNVLLTLHDHLTRALHIDPLHQLALLVTTLDPLWQESEEDHAENEGDLELGLLIARRVFPELYVDLLLQQRASVSQAELHRLLCVGFTERGIPLDDVSCLSYGIPLTAYGLNLSDPDVYTHHPSLEPILSLFGLAINANSYDVDIPQMAYRVGRLLADSLVQQADAPWQQVGWLLAWVFSCSGNTLIDADEEELGSIQPLSWEAEDVTFGQEMIAEAERVLRDVEAAEIWLNTYPSASDQLRRHIHQTYRSLKRADKQSSKRPQKGKRHDPHVRLAWTAVADSPSGTATADLELL